jgi:hypothetical protein
MQDVQLRQEIFISTISRELKTCDPFPHQTSNSLTVVRPVAGIIGLLELLYGTRKDLNEEQLSYIRQTFGSLNSLREDPPLSVASQLMLTSRVSAGDSGHH